MDDVANYQLQCSQSTEAIRQDYYNGQPPFKGAPAAIPMVPVDTEGNPLDGCDVPFEYVEILLPDARNMLAVLTQIEVANGPGPKYHVTKVG